MRSAKHVVMVLLVFLLVSPGIGFVQSAVRGQTESGESGGWWIFEGTAGDVIEVVASADDFDPTVEVLGPDMEVMEFNDDGGRGDDARLIVVLTTSGSHVVRVGSYERDEGGAYTVVVRKRDVRFLNQGVYVADSLGGDSDGDDGLWSFEGRAGRVVSVAARSEYFDTTVQLLDPAGDVVASNDDAGDGTDSELLTILPVDGRYVVRVSPYEEGDTGAYEVRWREVDRPPFELGGTLSDEEAERGVIVEFEAAAGEWLIVDASSTDFDTIVELLSPDGQVMAFSDDDGLGSDSALSVILSVDGRYRVRVASFFGGGGAYELSVAKGEPRRLELGRPALGIL